MIWRPLAAEEQVVEIMIELNGRLDGLKHDGITDLAVKAKSHQRRHAPRRGNGGLLQPLQAVEFAQRGIAAKEPFQRHTCARIKFQKVRSALMLEAPDLTIATIFNERAETGEFRKGVFQLRSRHTEGYTGGRGVCLVLVNDSRVK